MLLLTMLLSGSGARSRNVSLFVGDLSELIDGELLPESILVAFDMQLFDRILGDT